jgi:DNA-3-methyladenine glycosylase II
MTAGREAGRFHVSGAVLGSPRHAVAMPQTTVRFSIALDGTIDLPASFAPLGRSGDDGLDRWDGRLLVRTLRLPGHEVVPYLARPVGSLDRPSLEVEIGGSVHQPAAAAAIAATIEPDPAAVRALGELAAEDAAVRALIEHHPGVRPVLFADPFTALVRSISAQQVNLHWAAAVRRRLAVTFGRRHPIAGESVYSLDAGRLAGASVDELRALQLTTAKSAAVVACARAAVEGRLERDELSRLEDEELVVRLTELPGIGRWSAEWFLARTLGRPRVVAGDLGVRKAVGRMYVGGSLPDEAHVRRLTTHWGAAASLVQALALHDLAEAPTGRPGAKGRVRPPPPPIG